MYSRLISLALAGAVGVAFLPGCQCRPNYVAARPCCPSCVDSIQPPPRVMPIPAAPYAPPPPVGSPSPAGYFSPAPESRLPAGPPVSVPASPPDAGTRPLESSSFRADPPPAVRLLPPEPIRRDSARKTPDATKEPPVASVPEKPAPATEEERETPKPKEPPVASVPEKPAPATEEERETPKPIDIPGYALARPNVATGLRPFPDGIDWLKERGYKVVLHLRAPGEDNTAAQRQFEKKGLRYLSLEASPARLTPELYQEFNKLVTDTKNLPLFVYDKDGSVAGGLWYLHFRVYLKQTDDKARAEAERLGLRPADDDVEHRTMWLAVQALLKKLIP